MHQSEYQKKKNVFECLLSLNEIQFRMNTNSNKYKFKRNTKFE